MVAIAAFVTVWLLSVATWVMGGIYLAKAARRARPGTSWWTRTNPLSPLTHPDIWPPEAKRYWRLHYVSLGVFLALCALGMVLVDELPEN